MSCHGLKTVIFENNSKLEYIGNSAFKDCINLSIINIPKNLNSIGKETFLNSKCFNNVGPHLRKFIPKFIYDYNKVFGKRLNLIKSWADYSCTQPICKNWCYNIYKNVPWKWKCMWKNCKGCNACK